MCIYLPGRVRELSFFILLPRSRFIGLFDRLLSSEKTVLLFNYYPGERYTKLAGTTTLAYIGSILTALPLSQYLNWCQRFVGIKHGTRLDDKCFVVCKDRVLVQNSYYNSDELIHSTH